MSWTATSVVLLREWKSVSDSAMSSGWISAALTYLRENLLIASTHPIACSASWLFLTTALCWIMSVITNNFSQVDKLWSIIPVIYVSIFAAKDISLLASKSVTDSIDWRLILMFGCSLLWGVRLTFNFWRKGGYTWHGEDYRWPIIKKILAPYPIFTQIFNFTFIAVYQNILLFLIVSPSMVCYLSRNQTPLNSIDLFAAICYLCLLTGETVADQQQWIFQNAKYAKINAKAKLTGDYARGFLTSGLFRYSRHPNFFCEMSLWWSFYLFSVAATGSWVNWTALGAFLLTQLFQGSTWLTERITKQKYPSYGQYQQTTSRIIPWFAGPPLDKKSN
eukprot:GILJ01009740.1.p1 GENE.GILJ01009740.1~~GILJ01009740.1.p1  ORF type:complete len:348 (+),score=43.26 GILJ01009740.1:44-1045(+)